ncbi:flagellin [Paracoccaceae bacterium]|nr:flagellin [Paracoccaceae bacterium]
MANLGILNASYYADTSISRLNRKVDVSVEKVSSNKANIANGDKTSLVSMDNSFKLDLAATNAAVKNMSVAQAYLSTAISTLDNASAILTKIHELAVLGANGSNSDADNAALNTESEALIDAFHKSMTVAQFKGKEVFTDEPSTFSLASGGRSNSIQFGVGKVDYDVLYDYTNPGLTSLSSGVKYEIKRDLSDAEKTAILSRSSKLTADQLVKGFQFTTDPAPVGNTGDGTITINPNGTNIHNYAKGSGVQRFDAAATANGLTDDFKSGFIEVEITENYELSDNLSVKTAGNITVNNDGVIFFTDAVEGQTIEIGKVDDTKNGQNGTTLKINFHADATIPGTSNIINGDFSKKMSEVISYSAKTKTIPKVEKRDGFIQAFQHNGSAVTMGAIADANRTYKNVTLGYKPDQPGVNGSGTVRAHIQTSVVGGTENITHMEIIDGGKDFKLNEILLVPNDGSTGNIGGDELKIVGTADDYDHTVTTANTTTVSEVVKWPDGTPNGQYDFTATGAPADGTNNLTYKAGDTKKFSREDTIQVPDKWPNGTPNGQYAFDAGGAPADGTNNLTYKAGDTKVRSIESTTTVGENTITSYSLQNVTVPQKVYSIHDVETTTGTTYNREDPVTETVPDGFTPNYKTVAENWTRFMGQIDFGSPFTISEFSNQTKDVLDPANGTVNKIPRVEYSIPTPTDAQMAQPTYEQVGNNIVPNSVKGNDNTTVQSTVRASDITVTGDEKLKLDTGEFWFPEGERYGTYHGPAAVSDVFAADKGDFLKLDYTALGVVDNYNVAGYIYQVNPDGSAKSAPIMALSDTGKQISSRASVEVPENGNYRFVFIVGTHDLTGGKHAGADMTIDNIVAEKPYTVGTGAVSDLLKAIHFENNANAANPNKTLVTKVSNQDGTTVLTDDALINMQNFALTSEPDGPYMLAPTLDFTTQPSEGGTGSAIVLTKKIETVQERLNLARTQAGSQYGTLEEAINITTDLRSQFALGSGTLSDLNFSIETVNLTRRQMQQDVATTVLAQANKAQSSLVTLVDGSYRSYLNS